ncbi:aminomethyltransferase beta-barrel domain-containing protein, partial [Cutibacterium acnes]
VLACALAVVSAVVAAAAPSLPLLAVALFLVGGTDAVFGLARQSYVTAVAPPLMRARALSTLGGVHRIGLFLGPFAGALVVRDGERLLVRLDAPLRGLAPGQSLVVYGAGSDSAAAADDATDAGPDPSDRVLGQATIAVAGSGAASEVERGLGVGAPA